MNRNSTLFKRIVDFLYDHYLLKQVLEILKYLFFSLSAALIFAIGFTTFITPQNGSQFTIATGGVSGISQIIAKILFMCGFEVKDNVVQSVCYTVLNIPLLIFAFFFIGKKFSIFSAINVVTTSLLITALSKPGGFAAQLASIETGGQLMLDSILIRIILAAICTGVSSALAFVGNISCGGIDIISYYLGMKTSTQLGKYNAIINGFIFTTYSLLSVAAVAEYTMGFAFYSIFFSILYSLIVSLVIDLINLKNKKVRIEVITTVKHMGDILISNFPHGATMENAQGVYSKKDKYIILMTVSSNEYKKVMSIAKKVDPYAFVSVFLVSRVYGNFYSKPVE